MKDYKKILEGVVNIINTTEEIDIGFDNICAYIDENCPELKESEDERIRKDLLGQFEEFPDMIWRGHYKKDVLAWIEKQKSIDVLDEEERKFADDVDSYRKDMVEFYKKGYNAGREAEKRDWLEKQGEQKHTIEIKSAEESLCIDSATNNEIVDACIYDVQKPADKPEPKFHEGDWAVSDLDGIVRQISEVHFDEYNNYYVVDGKSVNLEEYDRLHHLWTIKDAKDGDVLYSTGFHGDCIFIFNGIDRWRFDEPNGDRAVATGYCCLTLSADNMEFDIQGPGCIEVDTVKPSTKEQYVLLFCKMKEASYEWNSVTKDLKRINKFKVGDWIVFNGLILHIDKVVNGYYITTSIGDIHNSYDWDIDNMARLWAIQDAKAGDILVNSITKKPFVYNGNYTSHSLGAYFGLNYKGELLICDSHGNNWSYLTDVQPATEEQRNMLFKKLHDSDYKWDNKKKELWHKYL